MFDFHSRRRVGTLGKSLALRLVNCDTVIIL